MSEADYYQLIGVGRDATLHEIRSKFRAKVLAEHPDKGGDPKKFQLLNKAGSISWGSFKRALGLLKKGLEIERNVGARLVWGGPFNPKSGENYSVPQLVLGGPF